MTNLVSCGDNVKIWDSSGYTLLHQFQPNNTNDDVVTDVSWSRDGGMVASVTSRQSLLVVTGVTAEGTKQLSTATELPKPTCCRFCSSNSRYICVGSHSGVVDLWDNKNGKPVKQYQGHKAPVTRVCFSASDRHVASASRAGQVLVHNITSGVVTELPTARNEPQCARDLRYSVARAAVLGAAFDTGQVALWDVNQRRLLHSFSAGHVAPAAALAFSPVNDILLVSVGLDKRLVCYDPKSRSIIQTVSADFPLTAVDFHPDGVRVAVGTSQGRVCVYDLRSPMRPVRSFAAHRSSVQRVQFQPPARGRSRSVVPEGQAASAASRAHSAPDANSTGFTIAERSDHAHPMAVEKQKPSPPPGEDATPARAALGDSATDQSSVFSPLRDEDVSHVRTTRGSSPLPHRVTPNGASHPAPAAGRDSSLFSPVRGDTSLASAPASASSRGGATLPSEQSPAIDQSSLFSPVRPDLTLEPSSRLFPSDDVGGSRTSGHNSSGLSVRFDEAALRAGNPGGRHASPDRGDSAQAGDAQAKEAAAAGRAESAAAVRGGPDGGGDGAGSPLPDVADGERRREALAELAFGGPLPQQGWQRRPPEQQQQQLPAAAAAQPLPTNLVQKLDGLEERIDDMYLGMRRQHFNTQWSVGKHMYDMRNSMETLAATVQALQTEVGRLREENQYLGCKF